MASLIKNFAGIAPQNEFFRGVQAAQQAKQQSLVNQLLAKEVPFKTPLLEQQLAQQIEASKQQQATTPYTGPLLEQALALQRAQAQAAELGLPYVQSGLEAQQSLLREQANLEKQKAIESMILQSYPAALARTDIGAAGILSGEGVAGGAAGAPYGQPGYSGNQPYYDTGFPGGGGSQYNIPFPNHEQEQTYLSKTMGGAKFTDRNEALRFLNESYGTPSPGQDRVGDLLMAKGYNPSRAFEYQLYQDAALASQQNYRKSMDEANLARASNDEIRMYADSFIDNYKKASLKGPFYGNLAYFGDESQAAMAAADALIPLLSKRLKNGNITDSLLDVVSKGKLSIRMNEDLAEHAYNKIISATERMDQEPQFLTFAKRNGLTEDLAKTMWYKFQQDYPLTGNIEVDRDSYNALMQYADPVTAANVVNGTHEPPRRKKATSLTDKEIEAMPPKLLEELVAREEAEKMDKKYAEKPKKSNSKTSSYTNKEGNVSPPVYGK